MKRIVIALLLGSLTSFIAIAASGTCITVDNSRCDSTFGSPNCSMSTPGSKCIYDSGGCRSTCGGSTAWGDCDPDVRHCPDQQFP